uniref:SWIM-type domain-containing protein n=1 Tax=Tanacetum cinerariifolium TaxID=118510 RepID=A0A6L2KS60_TANCI|nr:hypothetical protein [Tanacetum cinerariifolium]
MHRICFRFEYIMVENFEGYTGESEPLFYNYLRPLTSLDEGLYASACEKDVCYLATLVRSSKLIEQIELKKMLLLTWHESSEPTKEPVCNFVTPSSLPQYDSSTPCKDSVCESITPRSDVESSRLSHDESFGADDLDLNLNEPVKLNVSQIKTQSELPVSKEPDVGRPQEPIVAEVSTQKPIVEEENEIVEPDVDVHLFGDDVDVINANGFDSDPGKDDEISNYRWRSVRIRARCDRKVHVFTMSQGTGPIGPNRGMKAGPSGSSGPSTKSKERNNTVKAVQDQLQRDLEVQIFMSKDFRDKAKAEKEIRGYHVLQYSIIRDYIVELQSTNPNTTVKIAVERNTDPSLPTRVFQRIYVCLGALKRLQKRSVRLRWCFHEGAISRPSRAKSDLLLNNICEVFNGKIVGECIKKEAHFMKVQWNRANKYQVPGSLGDQCVVDVVTMTCSCSKWELTRIPCKHVIAACWNMALNDQVAPPPEAWVNPCYWSDTWTETYTHKVGQPRKKRKRSKHEDEPFVKDGKLSKKGRTITCQSCGNTSQNKAICKGQGQKATTGRNNAEASGSASRQAQQTKLAVGQDGLGGSGTGAVIDLYAAAGQGDASGAGGLGEDSPSNSLPSIVMTKNTSEVSDNSKFLMVDEEDLVFKKISHMAEEIMVMLREGLGKKDITDSSPPSRVSAILRSLAGLVGGGYLRDYVRVVAGMDHRGLSGGGYLREYVRVVVRMDDGG